MKKIAIITATRAEYGLLQPVIMKFRNKESDSLKVELIVTGTHLSDCYGMTVNEIIKNKIRIDEIIEVSVDSSNAEAISNNMAEVLVKFTTLFEEKRYSAIMILGDRYEMLSIAIAGMNTRTPIFHLYGGDTTEGAIDECIRHSITKMSYLHFVTNEVSKKRVIQLGEDPKRVYNVGSTSTDNILNYPLLKKEDALKSIGLENCTYALCTYHPVTLGNITVTKQIKQFISAIKAFPQIEFIVTKSNADQGGNKINLLLDEASKSIKNMHVYTSLGVERYLSLMKSCEFVIGNSSSGIMEAPILRVPTINIGDRQKGRLQSKSILNCDSDTNSIIEAINMVSKNIFKEFCHNSVSPYGNGHASDSIVEISLKVLGGEIDLRKTFFNVKDSEK